MPKPYSIDLRELAMARLEGDDSRGRGRPSGCSVERRQMGGACAGRLDHLAHSWSLLAREIVHDDDVAGRKFGHGDLAE